MTSRSTVPRRAVESADDDSLGPREPPLPAAGEVTGVLREWSEGDQGAPDRLLPLVYEELRRLSRACSRGERLHHTLPPTALVHEAWIQMVGSDVQPPEAGWRNREHFLRTAARVMRHVLVDYARQRGRLKRGGRFTLVPFFDETDLTPTDGDLSPELLLAVDRALDELERLAPQEARVVELRYFGGLTLDETADCMGLSRRTVVRLWRRARAWLRAELDSDNNDDNETHVAEPTSR